jgi:hypothetical protein
MAGVARTIKMPEFGAAFLVLRGVAIAGKRGASGDK